MTTTAKRPTPWLRWLVLVLLLLVPICEIALVVKLGATFGGWKTFGLLIIWSIIGAWLVRREWSGAWRGLREAMRTGVMPADELADAALVLVGGLLILLPGFITDFIGLLMILPFTRPLGRRLLQLLVARRIMTGAGRVTVIKGERVPPTYTARPHETSEKSPDTPMAPGKPGAIEGKIVRD